MDLCHVVGCIGPTVLICPCTVPYIAIDISMFTEMARHHPIYAYASFPLKLFHKLWEEMSGPHICREVCLQAGAAYNVRSVRKSLQASIIVGKMESRQRRGSKHAGGGLWVAYLMV